MLGFQLLVARALCQRLCRGDGGPGLFGELFSRGLHRKERSTDQTVWLLPGQQGWRTDANGSVCHRACGQPTQFLEFPDRYGVDGNS